MKKLLLALIVTLVASTSYAYTIDYTELQGVFDDIGSTITAETDDTGAEVFASQTTGATAQYIATVSFGYDLSFGLYDVSDASNVLYLFNSSNQVGDNSQIYIDYAASTGFTSFTMDGGYSLVDEAVFASNNFGFFVETNYNAGQADTVRYYSQADLNSGGNDRFLTYEANGDMVTLPGIDTPTSDDGHWYIAAEAGNLGVNSDVDFSDFVIQVESMQPVPEPATLLLLGSGLLGLAYYRRRK